MLRLVYLFVITAAIRRDTSFSLVQEKDGGSKTTCQYTVERGRPEPRDGTFRRTHWKKVVTYYKDQDFLQCRARCDALPTCVAFIRRASDDVGYLGMSMKSLRAADDDPTKLLEVPNDVVVGDCWLLETGKLAKYKLIEKSPGAKILPWSSTTIPSAPFIMSKRTSSTSRLKMRRSPSQREIAAANIATLELCPHRLRAIRAMSKKS